MSTKNTNTTRNQPVYRLGFAPYDGVDKSGQPKLGYPIELGACFERKSGSGLVAKFKMTPDLREGVLLLMPPLPPKNGELSV